MDYFSEEYTGTEFSVNLEGAETEKEQDAYKKSIARHTEQLRMD